MEAPSTTPQSIEKLRERFEKLNTQRITAEAHLRNAQDTLDRLKAEAKEKWQTDDLGELRKKREAMEVENERKRSEYQVQLDKIETDLKAVEEKFNRERSKK